GPPLGPDSLHEPKWDGFRFQVIKDGDRARLHSKSGAEYTNRLPNTVDAFKSVPTRSAVLDGEVGCPGGGRKSTSARRTAPDPAPTCESDVGFRVARTL